MSEVLHIRTQLREAVISHMGGVVGEEFVGDGTRFLRKFQPHNLPFIGVDVGETYVISDSQPPGDRTVERQYVVDLRAAADVFADNSLTVIDTIGKQIEQALFDGSIFESELGPLKNWRCLGTARPEIEETEDGALIAATTSYGCSIYTRDATPATNTHKQ